MQDLVCYRGRFFFLTSREEFIVFTLWIGDEDDPNGNGTRMVLTNYYSYYNIQQRHGYNDDVNLLDSWQRHHEALHRRLSGRGRPAHGGEVLPRPQ